jgi:hypothetical protein
MNAARAVPTIRIDPLALAGPVVVFALYCFTLPPGVMVWDTGEAQIVPWVAGIYHPSGFPFAAMIGWLFSHLFVLGNVAWRMNLFSALCGAALVAMLAPFAQSLGASALHARLAAVLFGVSPNAWLHLTRAAVEPLAAVCFCAALIFALRESLVGVALGAAFALASHPFTVWLWPGLWAVALRSRLHTRAGITTGAAAIVTTVLVALACYVYVPIRAYQIEMAHVDPLEGLPISGSVIWNNSNARTPDGLFHLITAGDFAPQSSLPAIFDPLHFPGFAAAFFSTMYAQFGLAVLLAIAGIAALRRTPLIAVGLVAVAFGIFPYASIYFTLDPSKYYLPSLWVVAALIGAGTSALVRAAQEPLVQGPQRPLFAIGGALTIGSFRASTTAAIRRVSGESPARLAWLRWLPIALVAFAILSNVTKYADPLNQQNDRSGYAAIDVVLRNTPDDAVVQTQWWFAMPLMYEKFVENGLGRRIVICAFAPAIEGVVRYHPKNVFIIPMSADDTKVAGVRFVRVGETWPALYRALPGGARSGA